MVYRVFVEKKPGLDNEARALLNDARNLLGISALEQVRVLNRYDAQCISKEFFDYAVATVFSEPQLDIATAQAELDGATVFAVESVRDPGNMGTVIRTAAAFGVDVLLISSDCADLYNPRTVRAAMGALFRQKIIRVDDMPAAIGRISENGRKTYAATLGKSAVLLGEEPLKATDCIIVGNEGHGLSEATVKACNRNILIPMAVGAESLNAAVAASVCMWEQFGRNLSK